MQTIWRAAGLLFTLLLSMIAVSCGGTGSTMDSSMAIAPVPGFTLSVSPAAITVDSAASGTTTQAVEIAAAGVNGFSGSITVAFSGLPNGATVSPAAPTLVLGTPQSVMLSVPNNTPSGTTTVNIAGSAGSLTAAASLSLTVTAPPPPPPPPSAGISDVTTQHNDNARTGQNLQETMLTPSNVNSAGFGIVNFFAADGRVDAQPLYLKNLMVAGQMHNVLYAASEHDSVYAFDADTGTQLWKTSLVAAGETTSDPRGCFQIEPEIGVTSTPVIDRTYGTNGAIFVVAMTLDNVGHYHQRLHALDVTTGAELTGSPVEVQASYPGAGANSSGGMVVFDPGQYAERAGLLLLNGTIYTAWTSHCDYEPYTGWLIPYSESTLAQGQVLNLIPNGSEGAIWMSGAGPAADANGNIFLLDANGTFDTTLDGNGFPSSHDFGNAFVRISTTNGALAVTDYFSVDNTASESGADVDLGSGGAMLLPDVTDSNGQVHQLAVGAGKDTNVYVVDRNNMGKFNAATNNSIYQELAGALPYGIWSSPAYFNNAVYYAGVAAPIEAFPIVNAKLATAPTAASTSTFVYPGATPSISADGASNGIVWAVANTNPAVLYAFNASNLQELYDSTQAPAGRDGFGAGNKFITPTIANGKVFVGTPTGVAVFGLLP